MAPGDHLGAPAVSHDAQQTPQPGRRPDPSATPQRAGARRPLQRAGTWTREHWRAARARIGQTHLEPRTRKALTWTGAVAGLLAIAIAVLIAVWDWNWFRGPVERIASARMNREVVINGDLHVDIFSWQPKATVDGVRIANTPWAGQGPMANIRRMAIQIRLLPLLRGRVDLRLLEFDQPRMSLYRDAQGRANWNFGAQKSDEPLRLPPIRDFVIKDGRIEMRDVGRDLTFKGTLNASEQLGAQNRGFEMRGQGTLNTEPFSSPRW